MEKGVIVVPAKATLTNSSLRLERPITSQELRYFLLYWDKVAIPTNNLIRLGIPEEDKLISTGVVIRPNMNFSGFFDGSSIISSYIFAQTSLAKQLIAQDKETDWTIHQIGDDIILPSSEAIKKQIIRVDLVNTLPVPDQSVSIEDILDFKERRKDELKQLHKLLDDFYLEILSSSDQDLKTKKVVDDLKDSIMNVQKTTSERWAITKKFDVSAELNLNLKDILGGIAIGEIIDHYNTMTTIPIGKIIGVAASLIKITAKQVNTFEAAKNKQVLGYLLKAHEEKLLK